MTEGTIRRYLTDDHERLDDLLERADQGEAVDVVPYEQFRVGLLRHIAIEEKLLFPELRVRSRDLVTMLHADHAALASLLVPTPTPALLRTIREVLGEHNPLEEDAEGLYDIYEQASGEDLASLLARAQAIPPVRASKHVDGPRIEAQVARMVAARSRTRT